MASSVKATRFMKRLENMITDAMGLIENVANEVENNLVGGIELEKDGNLWQWIGSYELDEQIFKAFNEEAIVDYFEDVLWETISEIKEKEDVGCLIYIEDGELVVEFSNAI